MTIHTLTAILVVLIAIAAFIWFRLMMSKVSRSKWVRQCPEWVEILSVKMGLSNYPVDKAWDSHLNKLIDSGDFSKGGKHTVSINGVMVWCSNYPFAYGARGFGNELPRASTRVRLRRIVGDKE